MMRIVLKWLRSAAAVLAGYALIVLLTTVTFKITGPVRYGETSVATFLMAGAGVLFSGLCGGYLASFIGRNAPFRHAVAVLLPLTADTIFVVTSGISRDPVWFDLLNSGGLMVATICGGVLRRLQFQTDSKILAESR